MRLEEVGVRVHQVGPFLMEALYRFRGGSGVVDSPSILGTTTTAASTEMPSSRRGTPYNILGFGQLNVGQRDNTTLTFPGDRAPSASTGCSTERGSMTLETLRQELAALDRHILTLVAERQRLATAIGPRNEKPGSSRATTNTRKRRSIAHVRSRMNAVSPPHWPNLDAGADSIFARRSARARVSAAGCPWRRAVPGAVIE